MGQGRPASQTTEVPGERTPRRATRETWVGVLKSPVVNTISPGENQASRVLSSEESRHSRTVKTPTSRTHFM